MPLALLKVYQTYQVARKYNAPIIGQGGVRGAATDIGDYPAGGGGHRMGRGRRA